MEEKKSKKERNSNFKQQQNAQRDRDRFLNDYSRILSEASMHRADNAPITQTEISRLNMSMKD